MRKLFVVSAALCAVVMVGSAVPSRAVDPFTGYMLVNIGSRIVDDLLGQRRSVYPAVTPAVNISDTQGIFMGVWMPEQGQMLLVHPDTMMEIIPRVNGGVIGAVEYILDNGAPVKVERRKNSPFGEDPFVFRFPTPRRPGIHVIQVHPDLRGRRGKDGWGAISFVVIDPNLWARAVTDAEFRGRLAGTSGTVPRIPVSTIVSEATGQVVHGIGKTVPPLPSLEESRRIMATATASGISTPIEPFAVVSPPPSSIIGQPLHTPGVYTGEPEEKKRRSEPTVPKPKAEASENAQAKAMERHRKVMEKQAGFARIVVSMTDRAGAPTTGKIRITASDGQYVDQEITHEQLPIRVRPGSYNVAVHGTGWLMPRGQKLDFDVRAGQMISLKFVKAAKVAKKEVSE